MIHENLVDLLVCVMRCDHVINTTAASTIKFVKEALSKKDSKDSHVLFLLTHKENLDIENKKEISDNLEKLLKQEQFNISKLTRNDHQTLFVPITSANFEQVKENVNNMVLGYVTYHIQIYHERRDAACQKIIWSFAKKAAALGLIPLVDIAMSIILNHNMAILLKAVLGDEDSEISGSVGSAVIPFATNIVNGFLLKAVFVVGHILAITTQLTIIGIIVGEGISVGLNFGFTFLNGYYILYSVAKKRAAKMIAEEKKMKKKKTS